MPDLNALSGTVTAVISALVAALTLTITLRHDREKNERQNRLRVTAFLGSIQTEIETLWANYMDGLGKELEAGPADELLGEWPTADRYFHVYESHAGMLGSVPDCELRNQIVRAYTRAQGLVDSIKLYARLYRSALEPVDQKLKDVRWDEVRRYQRKLRTQHFEVKAEIEKLCALLRKVVPQHLRTTNGQTS